MLQGPELCVDTYNVKSNPVQAICHFWENIVTVKDSALQQKTSFRQFLMFWIQTSRDLLDLPSTLPHKEPLEKGQTFPVCMLYVQVMPDGIIRTIYPSQDFIPLPYDVLKNPITRGALLQTILAGRATMTGPMSIGADPELALYGALPIFIHDVDADADFHTNSSEDCYAARVSL